MTVREAAERLGVSVSTVYRWIHEGGEKIVLVRRLIAPEVERWWRDQGIHIAFTDSTGRWNVLLGRTKEVRQMPDTPRRPVCPHDLLEIVDGDDMGMVYLTCPTCDHYEAHHTEYFERHFEVRFDRMARRRGGGGLCLEEFRRANVRRCEANFHPVGSWTPTDWATAMAGEMGEACNLIKKLRRGDFDRGRRHDCALVHCDGDHRSPAIQKIADEIADMVTYADLLLASLDVSLADALRRKFNVVSERVGSKITLPPSGFEEGDG